ncbi:MAG TPA: hypothetical protein DCO79_01860 [Spirochaeta sp.]|nr:hypothetical protein [Spirochaeta sp.]
MTIAIVLEIFLPTVNGVITATLNLAENLIKRGNKVIFIVPSWSKFTDKEINGIPVHYIPSIATYMYPGIRMISPSNRSMKKILEKEGVDIVHITGPWVVCRSAILSARRKKIPVIQSFHTLIYEDTYILYLCRTKLLIPLFRALSWWYIGRYVNKSDVMTAPSIHACNVIQEKFPKSITKHIRNGIDLKEFENCSSYEELSEKYPQFNDKTYVFVGRLGEEKAVSVLIEAFRLAWLKDRELRLFVIGDGPGKKIYERTVSENHMDDAIVFLGRLDHHELLTSGLYHYARALVTASTTENQPVTVLEAIGCSTPVIVPDVDGINELWSGNGMLFEANNAVDFADKLVKLANDEKLYQQCKLSGEKLKKKFDGMIIAEQFENLYNNVSEIIAKHSNQRS